MSTVDQQAIDSVIVLHQLIEQVFHGDEGQLPALIAHFDPAFEMITPAGKTLSLMDVNALFARLTGARKGVRIAIEGCNVITRAGDEVVIQYHELQQAADLDTHRISLAVIDCSTQPPRWRYLQETMITN